MKVRVRAFAQFGEMIGRDRSMDLDLGSTIRDLLEGFCRSHAGLRELLFAPDGRLSSEAIVMVNKRHIDARQGLSTPLSDGDEVALFPPAAGG